MLARRQWQKTASSSEEMEGDMDIENQLRQYLVQELQAPEDKLGSDYPLIQNHIIDSLGMLSIVSFIESEYEVEISDDEIIPDTFGSIGAIARLVETKLAEKAPR
jgi:acyl carrier protein